MSELYEFDRPEDDEDKKVLLPNESEPPESAKRAKKSLRFARMLLLLIMSVTAIVILFVNKDKINIDNFKRLAAKIDSGSKASSNVDRSAIDFDYNSTGKIKVYKDGIARVTDDNLVILDNIGKQFQSVLTGYTDPQIITGANYVCVFDRGSKKLMVADSFDVVFEHTFDYNIVTASMNDRGCLAVVTQSEAYKNHVIVFDSSFKEVYKINSLTRYIVSADISPDGKRIVVSSLYSEDEKMIPQINNYTLSDKDVVWTADFEGSIAVDVRLKSDGSTVALFDWGVCILDSSGKEKYRHLFGDDVLQQYAFDDGKYNAVITSASHNGVSRLTVFDNNGKQHCDKQFDFSVMSADILSDRIALLSTTDMYIYGKDGKKIASRETVGTETGILFSDKQSVVTVSASQAVYNILK